jgi:hypothetical protein
VLYFAKQQVAYHLLTLFAIVAGFIAVRKTATKRVIRNCIANPAVTLVGLYTIAFFAIAANSTLLIGLRHIFPVVVGAAMLTAYGTAAAVAQAGKYRGIAKRFVLVMCGAMVVSLVISSPFYLSYYNFVAGGTMGGYKVAVDSNYDWGQDIKLLEAWRQSHGVEKLYVDLHINPFIPLQYYFGSHAEWYKIENEDHALPSGAYMAVSAEVLQKNIHKSLPTSKTYTYLENHQVDRVGTSIFVFRVP